MAGGGRDELFNNNKAELRRKVNISVNSEQQSAQSARGKLARSIYLGPVSNVLLIYSWFAIPSLIWSANSWLRQINPPSAEPDRDASREPRFLPARTPQYQRCFAVMTIPLQVSWWNQAVFFGTHPDLSYLLASRKISLGFRFCFWGSLNLSGCFQQFSNPSIFPYRCERLNLSPAACN